jgi:hypothetical protein
MNAFDDRSTVTTGVLESLPRAVTRAAGNRASGVVNARDDVPANDVRTITEEKLMIRPTLQFWIRDCKEQHDGDKEDPWPFIGFFHRKKGILVSLAARGRPVSRLMGTGREIIEGGSVLPPHLLIADGWRVLPDSPRLQRVDKSTPV